MKISLTNRYRSAGLLLVFLVVVAAVVVVGIGGCVAVRSASRLKVVQDRRLSELTNELAGTESLGAELLAEHLAAGGDQNAFALSSIAIVAIEDGAPVTLTLMTSTNLIDWREMASGPLDGLLSVRDDMMNNINRSEPARFFKLNSTAH